MSRGHAVSGWEGPRLFDLKQNKLVWAGQSETTNPDGLDQFMRDLVKAVGADLRKKGVIAEPAS